MKLVKIGFVIMAAVMISFGLSTTTYAFHSGGVAECEGCHTMHNSLELAPMNVDGSYGAGSNKIFLLQGADQSSTCLNCHQETSDTAPSSYHIATRTANASMSGANPVPVEMTPGGDFAWLKVTTTYNQRGTLGTLDGARRGHSIIATDFGYTADSVNTSAPGGAYPATSLSCISCHNPHPNYRYTLTGIQNNTVGLPIYTSGSYGAQPSATAAVGVYRILGGVGYQPKSVSGSYNFTAAPPIAVAPSTYNGNEGGANETHVAYGSGMAQWCANCHTNFLNATLSLGTGAHPHPAGAALGSSGLDVVYNAYLGSGNNQAGQGRFTSLVPFEIGATDTASIKSKATNTAQADTFGLAPASTTSVVMCLSCHRAHASGFESMTRWYNDNEFITQAGAYNTGANVKGMNTAQVQAAYYGRASSGNAMLPFATYQRSFCNKCHAKD